MSETEGQIPHHERTLCYIAGPYTVPDPIENIHDAVLIAEELQHSGWVTCVVPHLNFGWHMICPHPADYWYIYDLAFLARCDCLLRIPGDSVGADKEVEFAEERGIPVFHKVVDVVAWAMSG